MHTHYNNSLHEDPIREREPRSETVACAVVVGGSSSRHSSGRRIGTTRIALSSATVYRRSTIATFKPTTRPPTIAYTTPP